MKLDGIGDDGDITRYGGNGDYAVGIGQGGHVDTAHVDRHLADGVSLGGGEGGGVGASGGDGGGGIGGGDAVAHGVGYVEGIDGLGGDDHVAAHVFDADLTVLVDAVGDVHSAHGHGYGHVARRGGQGVLIGVLGPPDGALVAGGHTREVVGDRVDGSRIPLQGDGAVIARTEIDAVGGHGLGIQHHHVEGGDIVLAVAVVEGMRTLVDAEGSDGLAVLVQITEAVLEGVGSAGAAPVLIGTGAGGMGNADTGNVGAYVGKDGEVVEMAVEVSHDGRAVTCVIEALARHRDRGTLIVGGDDIQHGLGGLLVAAHVEGMMGGEDNAPIRLVRALHIGQHLADPQSLGVRHGDTADHARGDGFLLGGVDHDEAGLTVGKIVVAVAVLLAADDYARREVGITPVEGADVLVAVGYRGVPGVMVARGAQPDRILPQGGDVAVDHDHLGDGVLVGPVGGTPDHVAHVGGEVQLQIVADMLLSEGQLGKEGVKAGVPVVVARGDEGDGVLILKSLHLLDELVGAVHNVGGSTGSGGEGVGSGFHIGTQGLGDLHRVLGTVGYGHVKGDGTDGLIIDIEEIHEEREGTCGGGQSLLIIKREEKESVSVLRSLADGRTVGGGAVQNSGPEGRHIEFIPPFGQRDREASVGVSLGEGDGCLGFRDIQIQAHVGGNSARKGSTRDVQSHGRQGTQHEQSGAE